MNSTSAKHLTRDVTSAALETCEICEGRYWVPFSTCDRGALVKYYPCYGCAQNWIGEIPDFPGPQHPLRYSQLESDRAYAEWKANCGPHSIAAACGITLDEVRIALQEFKGWMSPTMIGETLRALGRTYILRKGMKTQALCEGVNRIQWEGSWLNPGVPARVAYFHTHYVAFRRGMVLCTAINSVQWIPADIWASIHRKNGQPFHITHHYFLEGDWQ